MRVIDFKIEAREAVLFAKQSAVDLYRSTIAVDYGAKEQCSHVDLRLRRLRRSS